jgi:hypothetical protein
VLDGSTLCLATRAAERSTQRAVTKTKGGSSGVASGSRTRIASVVYRP